jgi:lipid II:glycine glycyltransferase (peptidoglycan interpeptide bridge formation enzyme)
MLKLIEKPFTGSEWTDVVSRFDDLSLMQTWEYGETLANTGPWHIDRVVFEDDGVVVGAIQAVTRRTPLFQGGFAWVNRGPLWRMSSDSRPETLALMMAEARAFWTDRRHMYLRIAPPVSKGDWDTGHVAVPGYSPAREGNGWASARLDLNPDLDMIRQGLDKRWRNSLANAERREVDVRCDSEGAFEQLIKLQRGEFAFRHYPTTVTPEFLSHLQNSLPPERKLLAFVASSGESLLGGLLIARYGRIGEYVAAVTEGAGRTANVGQLLLWKAIQHLKESGYRWFDLGGMDLDHTSPGILQFKAGLNALPYQYVGEFDALDSSWANRVVRWRVRRARKRIA